MQERLLARHSCRESLTLNTQSMPTFQRATRLSSITASMLVMRAECIPVIVTLARVTANCTASSIEFAEIPVSLIVFSTISVLFASLNAVYILSRAT